MLKLVIANFIGVVVTMVMIWLGLVYSRDFLGPWLYLLGAASILVGGLLSIGTRETTRIYWLGFSVASLGCLGYSWQFGRHGYSPPYHGSEFTVQVLWQIRDRYVADSLDVEPTPGNSLIIRSGWNNSGFFPGREKTFFLIGHMGWAILFGWLGANLALYVHSRHREWSEENKLSSVSRARIIPMIRLGTKELLLVVSVIGLTFVSLVQSNLPWATIYVSGTLLTVLLAVLSAIATQGQRRIFWIGFSVSALAYFFGMPRWQEYALLPGEFNTPNNQILGWVHGQLHPDYERQFPHRTGLGGTGASGGIFSVPESGSLPGKKLDSMFVKSSQLPETQDDWNPFGQGGNPFGQGGQNPFGGSSYSPTDSERPERNLATSMDEDSQDPAFADVGTAKEPNGSGRRYADGDVDHFFFVGHCAWTLLCGWLGGHFTCLISQRSRMRCAVT